MVDTLYELIGGRRTIQAAVDSFYRAVLADPVLTPFFSHTNMADLRAGQSMFLSMLLGGEKVYTGKNIRDAHAGARAQGLTDAHFDAILKHFHAALVEVGVEAENIEKMMTLVEDTRDGVLDR